MRYNKPENQGADALCEEEDSMFLINAAMERISIGTAALIVVLGMAVVFFGLILLMFVTQIAGKIISSRKKSEAPAAAALPPLPHRLSGRRGSRLRRPDQAAQRPRQDRGHADGDRRRQDRQAPQPAPVHLHPRDQGLTPLLHRDAHGSCAFLFCAILCIMLIHNVNISLRLGSLPLPAIRFMV